VYYIAELLHLDRKLQALQRELRLDAAIDVHALCTPY